MARSNKIPSGIYALVGLLALHVVLYIVLLLLTVNKVSAQNFMIGSGGFQIGMTKKAVFSYIWPYVLFGVAATFLSVVMFLRYRDKTSLGLLRLLVLVYSLVAVIWVIADGRSSEAMYSTADWVPMALVVYLGLFASFFTFYRIWKGKRLP